MMEEVRIRRGRRTITTTRKKEKEGEVKEEA